MKKMVLSLILLLLMTLPLKAQYVGWKKVETAGKIDSFPVVVLPTPPMIVHVIPPMIYKKWWTETMQCAGKWVPERITKQVQFWGTFSPNGFVLDSPEAHEGTFDGMTFAWDYKIIIVMHRINDPQLIKHEMLHFILFQHGIIGHPDLYFTTKCKLS